MPSIHHVLSGLRTVGIALALAAASGAVAAAPNVVAAPASGPAADAATRARAAIERKDWPAAQRELRDWLAREPRSADAHNLMGFALRKQGELAESKKHYDEALRLDPKHLGAHEYLGELYLTMGQPENAEKLLAALEKLCGRGCEEYQDLARAIAEQRKR
jgi:Tfp pilus assembly protein PilF